MDGLWIVLTIIFLVIEVVTAGAMVSIWFLLAHWRLCWQSIWEQV